MSDGLQLVITTIVAPLLSMLVAYVVTRRKERAETGKMAAEGNGIAADTAKKYRDLLNDEIALRRQAENERDGFEDEVNRLREENLALRRRLGETV